MRNFDDDLVEELKNPESAAYFANAQAESARELLECGVITELNETSLNNKTVRSELR
ncbi:hypothetical protein LCGC14_2899310 [marine sediment metagenome]|uniref:Uncharacterized protein n=1 Tax=marine sediment metagenome TaxID=412755 RepID=A0A0F8YGT2_9ZZZZ